MRRLTGYVTVFALSFATLFPGAAHAADNNKVMDFIDQAFVISVADQGASISYEVLNDGAHQTYYTNNKSFIPNPGQFVSFKAKDERIVDFKGLVSVSAMTQEKIMAKDTAGRTIDLEVSGVKKLASAYDVFQQIDGTLVAKSLTDVFVGAANVSVYYNQAGEINLLIINGRTPVDTMRIGLMNSGFASLDHSVLDIKSAGGMKLSDKKAGQNFDIAAGAQVTLTSTTAGTKATVGGVDLYTSPNRLYLEPATDALLQIMTFKRAYGNPSYRGAFEITPSATAGKLNLINEVQMENYLTQVVPSEMPASFGLEALKAQSVAARTYALSDYYSNRYAKKGFHVDDSTLSQVYNNSAENALTTQAVHETRGMVMESNGQLVDARYYSTSGGYGAGRHEVWSDANGQFPGTPINYLTAASYTYDPANPNQMLQINTQDEAALNAYYKNLSLTGYDSESYYFRWKVGFSRAELEKTVNSQLIARYAADKNFILTLDAATGNWVSKAIPATGAGTINNLYVAKRGQGGNMMELVIEGSTGTYKIVKEYNIRFTIRPSNAFTGGGDVLTYRAKGGSTTYDTGYTLKNYTILPSSFATFDIARDANGAISNVTFYGGGNGHGVGMSQYGASALGAKGWNYQQILNAYYSGMEIVEAYEL